MTRIPRIGAVYPDDVWVDLDVQDMINEFRFFLPDKVDMVTARTCCPSGEANAKNGIWLAENGEIEEAARRLLRYSPDCIAYFCTTVSFIRGMGYDEEIIDRIKNKTGLSATTTSTAMIKALNYLEVKRISLASPYMPDVELAFINFFEEHNFKIINSVALNLPNDHPLVLPEQICNAVEKADKPEADAIFVGCTGQKIGRHLNNLETSLGKPVLSANQVTVWHALQLIDHEPYVPGCGSLFDRDSSFIPKKE
jgi:maleate isomerase